MLIVNNVDRIDAVYNTNAPFEFGCALRLGQATLPEGAFLSIKIQCTEDEPPPIRISSATLPDGQQDACLLTFAAANGNSIGTVRLTQKCIFPTGRFSRYITRYIVNGNGVISGHVSYDPSSVGFWLDAARKADNYSVRTSPGDFMLLPQCCVSSFAGCGRALRINGQLMRRDAVVAFDDSFRVEQSTPFSVSPKIPKPEQRTYKGITQVRLERCENAGHQTSNKPLTEAPWRAQDVEGIFEPQICYDEKTAETTGDFWVGGRHLVLRAGLKSNIRIVTDAAARKITFAQPTGISGETPEFPVDDAHEAQP